MAVSEKKTTIKIHAIAWCSIICHLQPTLCIRCGPDAQIEFLFRRFRLM